MGLDSDARDQRFLQIRLWQWHDQCLERRSVNVFIVERDVDGVVTDLGGQIRNIASPIAVVTTINGRLAWPFHCHPQSTLSRASGIDPELGRHSHVPQFESRPHRRHLLRVTAVQTIQTEGLRTDGKAAKTNGQQVLAELCGREVDQKALGGGDDMGFDAMA